MLTLANILLIPRFHITPISTSIDGFLYAVFRMEHLVAALAIGLVGAWIGGRALWRVPGAYVAALGVAIGAGYALGPVDAAKYGAPVLVLVLGLALFAPRRVPEGLALSVAVLFGAVVGYAYSADLIKARKVLDVVAYLLGFVMGTTGLAAIGIMLGCMIPRGSQSSVVLRFLGGLVALGGAYLIVSA